MFKVVDCFALCVFSSVFSCVVLFVCVVFFCLCIVRLCGLCVVYCAFVLYFLFFLYIYIACFHYCGLNLVFVV